MHQLLPVLVIGSLLGSAAFGGLMGARLRGASVVVCRLAVGAALALGVAMASGSDGAPSESLFTQDRLGTTVAAFVALMAAIIGSFANRSLASDPRAPHFFAASNALVGSTIALALANRSWLMALSWVAVSGCVVALIGFDGRPATRSAARRALRTFALGDAGVIAGCALAAWSSGSASAPLAAVARSVGEAGSWTAIAVGASLLTGALVRSAQPPFSGWLISSIEAPTPVSAMLHAGVVNGSAILLIRWHPTLASSTLVSVTAVATALIGVTAGMAIGRTRPDVKGGLAWTTVAQMGFMTLQCALGLAGLAVIHLMAHGMFKASLFLGTGSGLDGGGTHRHPSQVRPGRGILAVAAAAGAGVAGVGLAIVRPEFLEHGAAAVPIAFTWATISFALAQWWVRTNARTATSLAIPVAVATIVFTALASFATLMDHWLAPSVSVAGPAGAGWMGAAAIAAIATAWLLGVVVPRRRPDLAARAWMRLAAPSIGAPSMGVRRTGSGSTNGSAGPVPSTRSSARSSADAARRERIRSTITRAANSLPQMSPLEGFVAMNPLADLESLPIEMASGATAAERGVLTEWPEEHYRALFDDGRITDDDLRSAVIDHLRTSVDADPPADTKVDQMQTELRTADAATPIGIEPVLLSEWHDAVAHTARANTVDEISSWWCAAFLGDHPAWAMPGRQHGLGSSWRALATHDARLSRLTGTAFADVLGALPERDDDAVMQLLVALEVDRPDHEAYLRRHLSRRHGWAGALIARSGSGGEDVVGYLVIRLAIEAALFANSTDRAVAQRAATASTRQRALAPDTNESWRLTIWRQAHERGYRDRLLSSLSSLSGLTAANENGSKHRPSSQAVFCIDPRSEGMRRHLESVGDHETIGYAGFFGMVVEVTDLDAHAPAASCPNILEPQAGVVELDSSTDAPRRAARVAKQHAAHEVFASAKRSAAGPFALAESFGWISGPWMAARTFAPSGAARLAAAVHRRLVPDPSTRMHAQPGHGWTPTEEVAIATSILRTTGLDRSPARLVMLCGHGSHHVNNLHRSALQCGACGGRAGGNNARSAASLLNDPAVRSRLADTGIALPHDTWFVAAEHDTTSDRVRVLDRDLVPTSHLGALVQLESNLEEAGRRLAAERGVSLPATIGRSVGTNPERVQRRGSDWAQVVAEFGLVGNAAMIIGPRTLTHEADLDRRVFLHSYESEFDADGAILSAILAGPLRVAHGINAQYRLSTIDPDRLGAGTKVAHNLIGGAGVIEGGSGDLRIGLPRESVRSADVNLHEPMRLLVVVDASPDMVERAIASSPAVADLVENGWINLVARPQEGATHLAPWALRRRDRSWQPWTSGDLVELPTEPALVSAEDEASTQREEALAPLA